MSRVSPAVTAEATAAFIRPGTPCAICGERAYQGGMWMGSGIDIYVCADPTCAEKLLLLALDARYDAEPQQQDRHRYAAWLRFADAAYERWAVAEKTRR